ncbi:PD-(D/E)XK motif protein [bacterium]|nr:PD-(D/E)XK motif protein [bacterium]MDB4552124.1 PD-(D/E)XK motif protein [bacterium]
MWRKIPAPERDNKRLSVVRFLPPCSAELFLAINEEGKRCLLLLDDSSIGIPRDSHDNLSLAYLHDSHSGYIAIRLDNEFFIDLFNDLIASIYNQVYEKKQTPELSNEFVQIFNRWSDFFDNSKSQRLSPDALQGLMGELTYLGHLLGDAKQSTVNEILESWRGPFNARTDFILPEKHVEVKTISNSSKQVTISSEYQLDGESGLGIELVVIYFEIEPVNGVSLREKVDELRELVYQLHGDYSLLLDRLKKLGVLPTNIGEYDNTRFKYLTNSIYDAATDGFPKLVRSAISSDINSVRYTLKLHNLSEFLIAEDIIGND